MKTTIKQATIEMINKVLKSNKKFYISSDFPFVQLVGFYLTYQAQVMNEYLREKGFTVVRAKDVNLKRTDVKVRANRNIWLKTENFINYKK
jgi:maleate cis-trans isomerase